jgi:hypothetical protein
MSEKETELTREVLEAMAGCTSTSCFTCNARDALCKGNTMNHTVSTIARALLAEMDKPKVWDGAPNNAHSSMVVWYGKDGSVTHSHEYTRELPKSRARVIAEEAWADCHSDVTTKEEDIARIESAILKREAELEAGK